MVAGSMQRLKIPFEEKSIGSSPISWYKKLKNTIVLWYD